MKNLQLTILLLTCPWIYAQMEVVPADAFVFNGGSTSTEINAISSKPPGFFTYDKTLNKLVFFNGTDMEVLGVIGGGSYAFGAPLIENGGTVTLNEDALSPLWANIRNKPLGMAFLDAIQTFTVPQMFNSNIILGDDYMYLGEDNGTLGRRWLWGKDQTTDEFKLGYQNADATDTSGAYSDVFTFKPDGSASEPTDAVTKGVLDAAIAGLSGGGSVTGNETVFDGWDKGEDNDVVEDATSPVKDIDVWVGTKAQWKTSPKTAIIQVITDSIPPFNTDYFTKTVEYINQDFAADTFYEILPAPGTGKLIVPLELEVMVDITTAYTFSGGNYMHLVIADQTDATWPYDNLIGHGNMGLWTGLNNVEKRFGRYVYSAGSYLNGYTKAKHENSPVGLRHLSGSNTGGTGSIKMTLKYKIIDI